MLSGWKVDVNYEGKVNRTYSSEPVLHNWHFMDLKNGHLKMQSVLETVWVFVLYWVGKVCKRCTIPHECQFLVLCALFHSIPRLQWAVCIMSYVWVLQVIYVCTQTIHVMPKKTLRSSEDSNLGLLNSSLLWMQASTEFKLSYII